MKKMSAGILMYRFKNNRLEFLLAHPGGPFYKNRDLGVWTIPKGELSDNEEPLQAAIREFKEELGADLTGEMMELNPIVQKTGKKVLAWAINSDFDPGSIISNTFPLEWPPKSGIIQQFPELDRVEWLEFEAAKKKIISAQAALLEELNSLLNAHRK